MGASLLALAKSIYKLFNQLSLKKKKITFYFIKSCLFKIIYLFCHILKFFYFAVNLVTSFFRQKPLKSKNKKRRMFWNTEFFHPAKFKLKRIINAKVVS